jgi:hypothetical protein
MAENKTRPFLDNLKKTAAAGKSYGTSGEISPPAMDAVLCCAKQAGKIWKKNTGAYWKISMP